ncbi:hypothetical protein [Dinghuibacter sp.]|uniref:hypothetical protein n=1 Tax=Dinghuibacter sp. TaxID=2024697 RepID=UPI002D7ECF9C|nr:hypothetical protein [Dinghuibacter sp.]
MLCSFCHQLTNAQSYGLRFSSHEAVQERRTTLNLTPTDNLCFRDDADLSFDLMLEPNMEVYFGYVFRIITADHQNIDLVFNEKLHNFNLIIGESIRGSFTIDSPHLYTGWTPVGIHFDRKDQTVSWSVNHVQKGVTRFPWKGDLCYRMCFGVSSLEEFQTADIPPMNIKDLRIAEKGETRFYWPLAESAGGEAFDSVSRRVAQIANPNWIKPLHQNWQSAATLEISGTPSVAFDAATEKLYIVGADSLYTYDVQKGQVTGWPLQAPAANLPPGNQSIVDPRSGFIYDVDIDEKSVRTYNPSTRRWTGEFPVGPLTEFWQANKFLSYGDTALYVVGGYGQLHYKNLVQRYSLVTHKWEVLHPGGDAFTPRYLAALGVSGDTAFIIGGYGSNTGDQMVNPRYDYDLVAYSVKDQRFKVLYHLSEPSTPFCFANSLVIDSAGRNYYGLIFQNDKFNSALQLIKGSLSAPVYSRMGDSIPYSFYDVKSFADLFYAPHSQRLLALTLYTNKENVTEVKVYTIAFPPNAIVTVAPAPVRHFPWKYALWAAAALVVAAAVWRSARRRQRRETPATSKPAHIPALAPAPVAPAPAPTPVAPDPRSQVYFFGQFEVYDPETHELTKLFTPLLKELFLLIAIHTLKSGKGISSEKLYATLWRDKSAKDAQNNRSVNMVKLKAILDKLGTCGIGKEADKWVLHYAQDQIRMDLADFLTLVHVSTPSHDDIRQLLTIIHRGAFLSDTAYPWLDDIQSEISDKALDVLSSASLRFEGEPEFLLEIAGGIFLFDPVNEEALRVKCKSLSILGRHSLAKVAFEKFAKEYHQMYGEEFQQSFHEILTN